MIRTLEFGNLSEWWFILLPIMIGVLIAYGVRKKNRILKTLNLNGLGRRSIIKWLLLGFGLSLVFVSLLEPRREVGVTEVKGDGLDIYVLIDTSKSMLATDIMPSRIDRAKKVVEELMNGLGGDRVGFIPYASSAYIQMPLTDDYNLASMFLSVIDTDLIGGGGTDVSQAISLAIDSFGEAGSQSQVLLILSDGEEHDINMNKIEDIIKKSDVRIYTVGIGTEEGSLIPVISSDGQSVIDYKKDDKGDLIMTRLDPGLLSELSNLSNGRYYNSSPSISEVNNLLLDFEGLERDETTTRKVKEYQQLFQWSLGLGLFLIMLL